MELNCQSICARAAIRKSESQTFSRDSQLPVGFGIWDRVQFLAFLKGQFPCLNIIGYNGYAVEPYDIFRDEMMVFCIKPIDSDCASWLKEKLLQNMHYPQDYNILYQFLISLIQGTSKIKKSDDNSIFWTALTAENPDGWSYRIKPLDSIAGNETERKDILIDLYLKNEIAGPVGYGRMLEYIDNIKVSLERINSPFIKKITGNYDLCNVFKKTKVTVHGIVLTDNDYYPLSLQEKQFINMPPHFYLQHNWLRYFKMQPSTSYIDTMYDVYRYGYIDSLETLHYKIKLVSISSIHDDVDEATKQYDMTWKQPQTFDQSLYSIGAIFESVKMREWADSKGYEIQTGSGIQKICYDQRKLLRLVKAYQHELYRVRQENNVDEQYSFVDMNDFELFEEEMDMDIDNNQTTQIQHHSVDQETQKHEDEHNDILMNEGEQDQIDSEDDDLTVSISSSTEIDD